MLRALFLPHPGHAAQRQHRRHAVHRHARVKRLGCGVQPADGKLRRGVPLAGEDGHGVLARRQRPQIHRLQVYLDAALLGDIAALVDGLAVHLHPLEAGEAGAALERQPVDAAGVVRGALGVGRCQQRCDIRPAVRRTAGRHNRGIAHRQRKRHHHVVAGVVVRPSLVDPRDGAAVFFIIRIRAVVRQLRPGIRGGHLILLLPILAAVNAVGQLVIVDHRHSHRVVGHGVGDAHRRAQSGELHCHRAFRLIPLTVAHVRAHSLKCVRALGQRQYLKLFGVCVDVLHRGVDDRFAPPGHIRHSGPGQAH